jgi:DNA gyrase subunit A
MAEFAKEVLRVSIEEEMKQSYLDYAMSVIVGRALPDVRDGLKPVHRRVLFAMKELNNEFNRPRMKSARVVGDVTGKYHPHGDQAVYDTLVRMAQNFSLRYLLVDGQGNFGSVDGDSPAAMRYTEVRLSKLAGELLRDIDRDTVNFRPNYSGDMEEPTVLPTIIPNLLVNGSAGIAVGMATNIPPHNLGEVVDGTLALLQNPDLSIDELMRFIPGPDFPTAGIINGIAGVVEAYRTGRGRIHVRGRANIEREGNRESIIITELPYQVNKARLVEKIAELHKEKLIEGIAGDGLRDESDKDGMRVVIDVKRGENAEILLNNLYRQTQLQTVFGINMVALVAGQPKILNIKEILLHFIAHRREVVTRRTIFEIRKARSRAHILEGLTVALANIDELIELIKTSPTPADAKERMLTKKWAPGLVSALLSGAGERTRPEEMKFYEGLQPEGYQLSDIQAKEILEMRLSRLTGLEQDKLTAEYTEILATITELFKILDLPERLNEVITDELNTLKAAFNDPRRTVIEQSLADLEAEDLIKPEDVVVTLSHAGYVKRQPLHVYRAQKRGGKGRSATNLKEEDFVEGVWVVNTHDTLLTFTSAGRVFKIKVYRVPEASSGSRGRPIVNLLPLEADEKIQAVLPVRTFDDKHAILFATKAGVVKKTPLSYFANVRSNGIRAIEFDEGDGLVGVALTDGTQDVMLFGSNGRAVRFSEDALRELGRTARGVRGMRFDEDKGGGRVVALLIVNSQFVANESDSDDAEADVKTDAEAGEGAESIDAVGLLDAQNIPQVLTATQRGYGKRTPITAFPRKGRGGLGVIAIKCSDRNGELVAAVQIDAKDDLMLISDQGTLVRTRAKEVALVGRNTQGVTLIRVAGDEKLVGVVRIAFDEAAELELEEAALESALDAAPELASTNPPAADLVGDAPAEPSDA